MRSISIAPFFCRNSLFSLLFLYPFCECFGQFNVKKDASHKEHARLFVHQVTSPFGRPLELSVFEWTFFIEDDERLFQYRFRSLVQQQSFDSGRRVAEPFDDFSDKKALVLFSHARIERRGPNAPERMIR